MGILHPPWRDDSTVLSHLESGVWHCYTCWCILSFQVLTVYLQHQLDHSSTNTPCEHLICTQHHDSHWRCKQKRQKFLPTWRFRSNGESEVKLLSCVQLFVTPWTVAHQAPLSMGFSRQECWSGLPFPSPGDFPSPGIETGSPALQTDALPSEPPGKLAEKIDV